MDLVKDMDLSGKFFFPEPERTVVDGRPLLVGGGLCRLTRGVSARDGSAFAILTLDGAVIGRDLNTGAPVKAEATVSITAAAPTPAAALNGLHDRLLANGLGGLLLADAAGNCPHGLGEATVHEGTGTVTQLVSFDRSYTGRGEFTVSAEAGAVKRPDGTPVLRKDGTVATQAAKLLPVGDVRWVRVGFARANGYAPRPAAAPAAPAARGVVAPSAAIDESDMPF